jgi:hypothetical protein
MPVGCVLAHRVVAEYSSLGCYSSFHHPASYGACSSCEIVSHRQQPGSRRRPVSRYCSAGHVPTVLFSMCTSRHQGCIHGVVFARGVPCWPAVAYNSMVSAVACLRCATSRCDACRRLVVHCEACSPLCECPQVPQASRAMRAHPSQPPILRRSSHLAAHAIGHASDGMGEAALGVAPAAGDSQGAVNVVRVGVKGVGVCCCRGLRKRVHSMTTLPLLEPCGSCCRYRGLRFRVTQLSAKQGVVYGSAREVQVA